MRLLLGHSLFPTAWELIFVSRSFLGGKAPAAVGSFGVTRPPPGTTIHRAEESVASSWKLNFELSRGEAAEYRLKRSGTSA